MTLCASGEMSLAGSTTGRSVACELGLGGTTQICMNQAAVRTLAGVPSGQISMSNFYGKSNVPALGCPFGGGYYIGSVSSPSNYLLILSPNASGCARCCWQQNPGCPAGVGPSTTDGYFNTRSTLNSSCYPAGNWTATRSIGGFSDWYLPAICEWAVIYCNRCSTPAGEYFADSIHWSSTAHFYGSDPTDRACTLNFDPDFCGNFSRHYRLFNLFATRAIRRQ